MNTLRLYVHDLIPAYKKFLSSLDDCLVGEEEMSKNAKDLCGVLHDLTEYVAKEHPDYINEKWVAANTKKFRDNLESMSHLISGYEVPGSFFGYIRDVANTSKHMSITRDKAKFRTTKNVAECLALVRYEDQDGYFYSHKQLVVVYDEQGGKIPLEFMILQGVLTFSNMLIDIGLIKKTPDELLATRDFYISREKAKKAPQAIIKGLAGVPINVAVAFYVYDKKLPFKLRSRNSSDLFEEDIRFDIKVEDSGLM